MIHGGVCHTFINNFVSDPVDDRSELESDGYDLVLWTDRRSLSPLVGAPVGCVEG